jgi:hypothetical protein
VLANQPCCPRVNKKDMLIDHDFWNIHDEGTDPRLVQLFIIDDGDKKL